MGREAKTMPPTVTRTRTDPRPAPARSSQPSDAIDIVVYTAMSWEISNRREFFKALKRASANVSIYVVDRPFALFPDIFRPGKWRQLFRSGLQPRLDDGVTVVKPITLFHDHLTVLTTNRFLNYLNILSLRRALKRAGVRPGMEGRKRFLWLYEQIAWPIAATLAPSCVVWEVFDDYTLSADGRIRHKWLREEPRMAALADHIFVLTDHLREKYRTLSDDVMVIGNGFDQDFVERPEPPGTPPSYLSRPGKRIGFVGRMRHWLDFGLISDLVHSCPQHSFVFLGPIDDDVAAKMRELARLPNVFLLEPVSRRCAYWHTMQLDVCLLPYATTRFTEGVKPIKMIEALACGVPVVTTLTADTEEFGDCVRHFSNAAEFGAAVTAFENTAEIAHKCRSLAASHSWDAIAARVLARLAAKS